jgi:ferric-dicitrate binding protein FerR (iron transport regulator)
MQERLNYLFLQYLNNASSQKELEEFFECIARSKTDSELRTLIRKVYDQIKKAHPSLTYVDGDGNLVFNEIVHRDPNDLRSRSPKKKLISILPIVLLILLSTMALWIFNKNSQKEVAIASVRSLTKKFTERKEQQYLLLPDSTQVWLNAASSLEFPDKFSGSRREVYLTGEAFFDVKHSDNFPFLIHTKNVTTTVIGTAFNIKAYQNQKVIIVSVSRGKVKVSRNDRVIATLTKGQQIRVNNRKERDTVIAKEVAVEKINSWQQGDLVYDDIAFEDIVKDLQNVFNVEIKIEDPAIGQLGITTSFNRDIGAQKAVAILCRFTNRQLINEDGTLIIK